MQTTLSDMEITFEAHAHKKLLQKQSLPWTLARKIKNHGLSVELLMILVLIPDAAGHKHQKEKKIRVELAMSSE